MILIRSDPGSVVPKLSGEFLAALPVSLCRCAAAAPRDAAALPPPSQAVGPGCFLSVQIQVRASLNSPASSQLRCPPLLGAVLPLHAATHILAVATDVSARRAAAIQLLISSRRNSAAVAVPAPRRVTADHQGAIERTRVPLITSLHPW